MLKYLNKENFKADLARPGFQRYFHNTGWMFFGQFFSLAVAFFIGAYIARYLGPKNFGLMSYVISFVGLFGFLAGGGADNILSRELIKFPEKKDELLSAGLWLKLGGAVLAIIVINIAGFLTSPDYLTRLLIFIFSTTFIGQSLTVISLYFQAQVLSKNNILAQLISTIISSILKLLIIHFKGGIIWLIIIYVFDSLTLGAGLVIIYLRQTNKKINWPFDRSWVKKIFQNSLPLMFTTVAVTIYGRIDQIIVKQMMSDTALGFYAAAAKLSDLWLFIPSIICASLFPAIVKVYGDKTLYEDRLKKLITPLLAIATLISIIIFLSAEYLIYFLFGAGYLPAAAILKIYIWSIIPAFLMVVLNYYLVAENYTYIYLTITIIGAAANIILNILLIPRYGTSGSAVANLISYALVPLSLLLFKKTRQPIMALLNPLN